MSECCSCGCAACRANIHCHVENCDAAGTLFYHVERESKEDRKGRIVTEAGARWQAFHDATQYVLKIVPNAKTQKPLAALLDWLHERACEAATIVNAVESPRGEDFSIAQNPHKTAPKSLI